MSKLKGTFEVTSGKIRVTDPCYDLTTPCVAEFKAENGTWEYEIVTSNEGIWGERVNKIRVLHKDYKNSYTSNNITHNNNIIYDDIGVDSGQCGFFDAETYKKEYGKNPHGGEYNNKSTFYGKCCALTSNENDPTQVGGSLPFGVVSSSGYGDGGYDCLVSFNTDGKAVAAILTFIDEND